MHQCNVSVFKLIRIKGCLQKKNSIWRDIVPTRGGGGKKPLKCPYLKYHFTRELIFREGGSQIIISFVLFVKIGLNA